MSTQYTIPTRIYLDYAAATPVHPEVLEKMMPYFSHQFGNPSAAHTEGQKARHAVEESRTSIARLLHVRERQVIFTGSGTESNNLAILGMIDAVVQTGRSYDSIEIISTAIEHPSIVAVLAVLKARGVSVRHLAVDHEGRIDLSSLQSLLSTKTVLVTYAYVNSEIGVVQDVKRINRAVKKYNQAHGTQICVHLDASQAPLWLPCELDRLSADLMTLDAGKMYGPKGCGVLAFNGAVSLAPQLYGGGQEFGLRAGTENTPLIVGCAAACVRAQQAWESRSAAVVALRDSFIEQIRAAIPESILNGSHEHRVANNINISIPGIDTEYAVVVLDAAHIAASTKSACSGTTGSGSAVVAHISGDDTRARSTIRFTLGEEVTKEGIEKTVFILQQHVEKMRQVESRMKG